MEQAMECSVVRDEMVEVLYGEALGETLRRVEEHLAICAACREEMTAFLELRRDLSAWKLPELSRGRRGRFRVRRRVWVPIAVAASFLLALGAGLALAGSELRFDDGHFAFRLGRDAQNLHELASAELRHTQEIEALRAQLADVASARSADSAPDSAVIQQVEILLRESEERQAQHLEASMRDLSLRTETQRRYDLARVSAGLSYLDGKTGQHVARTTELMGYVLQAAEKK
jgi:Putative zinc-finger